MPEVRGPQAWGHAQSDVSAFVLTMLKGVRDSSVGVPRLCLIFLLTVEQLFGPIADLVLRMTLSTWRGFDHLWFA